MPCRWICYNCMYIIKYILDRYSYIRIYNYNILLNVDIFMCKVDTVILWCTIYYFYVIRSMSGILKTDVR